MYAKGQLIGNLGKDPEFRSVGGKEVCNFSIATSKKIKGVKVTTWWNITSWDERKNKVINDYVFKGSKVFVEGELIQRKWTDKNQIERTVVEMDISYQGSITLLGDKQSADSEGTDGHTRSGGTVADRPHGDDHQTQREREPAGSIDRARRAWDDDLNDDVPF